MVQKELLDYLEFAKSIAKEADKIMKKYFIEDNQSSYKLDNTIEIPVASRKQVDFHKYWFQYLKRR